MAGIVSEDSIDQFICALSTEDNKHICEEAVSLSCNHHVCKRCIKYDVNYKDIVCKICNTVNTKIDHKILDNIFERSLNENIDHVFRSMLAHYKNRFEKLKQIINGNDEIVDLQVDFVKDEVQLRIESLKIELDKIGDSMNEQFEDIRVKWKNDLQESNKKLINEANIEIELNNLENRIGNNEDLTINRLYADQSKLKIVNNSIETLEEIFIGSLELIYEEKIDLKSAIGEFIHVSSIGKIDKRIIDRIKNGNYTKINLEKEDKLIDLCVHQDGNLLAINKSNISVYNKNFVRTRVVPIVLKSFLCAGVDGNCDKYLSRQFLDTLDEEFNESISLGRSRCANKVSFPFDSCFYNGSLFVCDLVNRRVQKFNSDLKYCESYSLEDSPWLIKNINNIACISFIQKTAVRFYNLDDFTLLKEYSGHSGSICVSEFCFYVYCPKIFFVYNFKGELVEVIKSNYLNEMTGNGYSLCIYDSKLLLASSSDSKLIAI